MSDNTGVNYFQHLPGSAYARSGEPATQAAQPAVPASNGQPQGTPTVAETPQYTPEQIQQFIKTAELSQTQAAEAQRRAAYYETRDNQFRQAQAQAEWEARRQQAIQEASQMSFDDALNHMANFGRQAEQVLVDQSKDMFVNFAAGIYADKLITDYELEPEDRILLGTNPDLMESAAKRLSDNRKRQRDEIAQIRGEVEQFSGQQYVQQRIAQGAYTSGGSTGRQPVVDPSQLSEIDQLRDALRG